MRYRATRAMLVINKMSQASRAMLVMNMMSQASPAPLVKNKKKGTASLPNALPLLQFYKLNLLQENPSPPFSLQIKSSRCFTAYAAQLFSQSKSLVNRKSIISVRIIHPAAAG